MVSLVSTCSMAVLFNSKHYLDTSLLSTQAHTPRTSEEIDSYHRGIPRAFLASPGIDRKWTLSFRPGMRLTEECGTSKIDAMDSATLSECGRDSLDAPLEVPFYLVLPETYYFPSHLFELIVGCGIPLLVSRNLRPPVLREVVSPIGEPVPVPEVPIDKNGHSCLGKGNVWFTR